MKSFTTSDEEFAIEHLSERATIVVCSDCGAALTFKLSHSATRTMILVTPHDCPTGDEFPLSEERHPHG
jgi:Fe2+ or Zn2+ uptake regulation protein